MKGPNPTKEQLEVYHETPEYKAFTEHVDSCKECRQVRELQRVMKPGIQRGIQGIKRCDTGRDLVRTSTLKLNDILGVKFEPRKTK